MTLFTRPMICALAVMVAIAACAPGCSTKSEDNDFDPYSYDARSDVWKRAEDSQGGLPDLLDNADTAGGTDLERVYDLITPDVPVSADLVVEPEDIIEPEDVWIVPDGCDCSAVQCGFNTEGCFCGACPAGETCTQQGQCQVVACDGDWDCPDGYYCPWNFEGDVDALTGLPVFTNVCFAQNDSGLELGAECSDDEGKVCMNEALCEVGHCSAICINDSDCAASQKCTVYEFSVDTDDDSYDDQALPLHWCNTLVGSQAPCFATLDCPAGEYCHLYEIASWVNDPANPGEQMLDPDGPFLAAGACVTSPANSAGYGEPCYYASDCATGWCYASDPDAETPGVCSSLCQNSSDCPGIEFGGWSAAGICVDYLFSWGGDSSMVEANIHFGMCGFTTATGADCSADYNSCPIAEACMVWPVTFGPDYKPQLDYLCTSVENMDYSLPTKTLGQACNPNAEDSDGYFAYECLSGMCFLDAEADTGYCSALCTPGSNDCAAGGPDLECAAVTNIPRKGKYQDNAATWFACRKDIECIPCYHSSHCPGDKVCVNLGQDDDLLADFRCVEGCAADADCAGATVTTCTAGKDGYGKPVKGCYKMGPNTPENHCK